MSQLADLLPDPPTEHLADRPAVVIPFPLERRRDPAEAEARRRHPTARTI